jgi:L-cysteine S-thiosulfotransferase
MRWVGFLLALATIGTAGAPAGAESALLAYQVTGDAIDRPLTGRPGDAARGEALVADRRRSLCLLCHAGPFPEPHAQGTLAPDLRGVGARLNEGQLRLRVVDMRRVVPSSIMPSYYRIDGLERVAQPWRGKPVLTAEEIEDVVAFLVTLKE